MAKKKPVMSHDPLAELVDDDVDVSCTQATATPDAEDAEVASPAESEQASVEERTAGAFELPDSLTIADVGDVYADLKGRLAGNVSLTLDGSRVESIDGAGAQLLAVFMKEAAERQIGVQWIQVSDRLQQAVDQLGLSSVLTTGEAA